MYQKMIRWLDIAVISIISVGLSLLFINPLSRLTEIVVGKLGAMQSVLLIFALSIITQYFLIINGGFRFKDCLSIRRIVLPWPIWMVGLVCAFLCSIVNSTISNKGYQCGNYLGAVFIFYLSGVLIAVYRSILTKIIKLSTVNCVGVGITDGLNKWISNNSPIVDVQEDLFDHKALAKSISKKIIDGRVKSICLFGAYGSGKTSILNLTERCLNSDCIEKERNQVIVARFNSWGFVEKADNALLRCVLDSIAPVCDCIGLKALPDDYYNAIQNINVWANIGGVVFKRIFDPEKLLSRLDWVLICHNVKVVVFVEDIERDKNDDKVRELTALIDRMKHLSQISFVLATTKGFLVEEMPDFRIFDNIELVPALRHGYLADLLKSEFSRIQERYANDIQLAPSQIMGEYTDHFNMIYNMEGASYISIVLFKFLDSPRSVKAFLNEVSAIWDKLHGNVNYDDLVILSLIKCSLPEVYGYVLNYADKFKISSNVAGIPIADDNPQKQELIHILERKWMQSKYEDVVKMICSLFPNAKRYLGGSSLHDRGERWQSVSSDCWINYWERLNRGELIEGELSDQEILQFVRKWKENADEAQIRGRMMASAFVEDAFFAEKMEYLAKELNKKDIQDIAERYFCLLLSKVIEFKEDEGKYDYPGFSSLWRMYIHREPSEPANHFLWFEKQLRLVFVSNMQLAAEIYYFWKCPNQYETDKDEPMLIIRKVVEELFKDDTSLIAVSMKNNENMMYVGYHIVKNCLCKNMREDIDVESIGEMQWYIDGLVVSASNNRRLVPQLYPFILEVSKDRRWQGGNGSSEDSSRENKGVRLETQMPYATFNVKDLERVFKDRYKKVIELFSVELDLEYLREIDKLAILNCQSVCRELLEDINESKS